MCFAADVPSGNNGTYKLLLTRSATEDGLAATATRKTERWTNFQHRINSAPDSPERGFELALYYAVTHDDQAGVRSRPLGFGSSIARRGRSRW